jgi:hypothetical protein
MGKAIALTAGGSVGRSTRGNVQHAQLRIFEARRAGNGGVASAGAQLDELNFQFNPKEMSIQKAAKWDRKQASKSKKAGPPEFTGSDPCKLSMELFFDATDTLDSSVVTNVERVLACCVPASEESGAWPPLVVLHWGSVSSFLGFVTSVQAKYTLFAADGTPIRATCAVTIEEMPETMGPQNPTSGTPATHAEHTVVSTDTLPSIAYREYGDPTAWRKLAAFNGIDDPLRLKVGSTLRIPGPAELGLGGG